MFSQTKGNALTILVKNYVSMLLKNKKRNFALRFKYDNQFSTKTICIHKKTASFPKRFLLYEDNLIIF